MSGVHKTYKLYIGGKFPRTESGRTLPLIVKGETYAQICRASRKDLRNAVEAARKALDGWSGAEAMLRGQILYRVSEMLWARRAEFVELLQACSGQRANAAEKELELCCDRLIYYAGFCDKYAQLLSSVNPVPGPFFDFSMPEPSGVIGVLPSERSGLIGLISCLAPVLVPGNTAVLLAGVNTAPLAMSFAEVLGTSDVPGGVVNILTGTREELLAEFGSHRGLDGTLLADPEGEEAATHGREAAGHVQRVRVLELGERRAWMRPEAQGLPWIEAFVEIKTAWHSMGR
jgi:acyl-CoA reductase-like NAD-dependent aldehyde dehydrogenase